MARTDTLGHFLTDVADAIRTKKGTNDTITASNFDTEITNLPSGGYSEYLSDEMQPGNVSMPGYVRLIKKFPQLTIKSGETSCAYMFFNCLVDKIDVSQFNTSNITDMKYMFYGCELVTELDLSSFNTANVGTMNYMFADCLALQKLDIRNFTFKSNVGTNTMFGYNTTLIPADCLIIVKSNTEKTKVLSIRNDLTNVKTVAEYEASLNE